MTTTEAQPPVNATQPHRYIAFGGPRLAAGLIDIALVVTAVAPLAIIDFGLAALAAFVVAAVYATVLEGGPSGQTVGKRVTGVRVVDATTGERIGHFRALVRHFGRVPFIHVGHMMFSPTDTDWRTWYDWALGTTVVSTRD